MAKPSTRAVLSGAAVLCVAALMGPSARGGPGISIGPLSLEISPRSRVAVLEIGNFRSVPVDLQAAVTTWTQDGGQDGHAPTDDVVISPAITEVPPGKRQVFRIAYRGVPDPSREQAYRVLVSDVTAPDPAATAGASVTFRITHSVPLFVRASMKGASALGLAGCAAPAGQACLTVRNSGAVHAKVREIRLTGQGWTATLTPNATLLAGASRAFTAPIGAPAPGRFAVQVETEDAAVSGDINAEGP